MRITQPHDCQFTITSTSASRLFCIDKSFMITFSLRKLVYAST